MSERGAGPDHSPGTHVDVVSFSSTSCPGVRSVTPYEVICRRKGRVRTLMDIVVRGACLSWFQICNLILRRLYCGQRDPEHLARRKLNCQKALTDNEGSQSQTTCSKLVSAVGTEDQQGQQTDRKRRQHGVQPITLTKRRSLSQVNTLLPSLKFMVATNAM